MSRANVARNRCNHITRILRRPSDEAFRLDIDIPDLLSPVESAALIGEIQAVDREIQELRDREKEGGITDAERCHLRSLGGRRDDLYRRLIDGNKRLVYRVVKGYWRQSSPITPRQMFDAGVRGLYLATPRFNLDSENTFSTYATHWIRSQIQEDEEEAWGGPVWVPVNVRMFKNRVQQAATEFGYCGFDLADCPPDILNRALDFVWEKHGAKFSGPETSFRLQVMSAANVRYRGVGTDDNGDSFDPVASLEAREIESEDREAVDSMRDSMRRAVASLRSLGGLWVRTADVLELRFALKGGERLSLNAVGKVHGLSRERVRQIEEKGIEMIREIVREGKICA